MRRTILIPIVLILGLAAASTLWILQAGLGGALLLNPDALDFGTVGVGEELQQVAIATNTGDETIQVDAIRVPEGFRVSRDGMSLAAGESAEIIVVFRPERAGELAGELVLEHASARLQAIPVRGSAQLPAAMVVSPLSVSFGETGVGRSNEVEVLFRNDGQGELVIEALSAVKPFHSDADAPTLRVPAGESRGVSVRFAPEKVGDFVDSLTIRSNDPERGLLRVRLDGVGVAQAPNPRIEVEPLSVDFGRTTSCTGPLRWVRVLNVGSDPLTLSAFRYPAGFTGPSRSRTVPPGREFSIPVTFAPRSAGTSAGELKIFSNDASASVVAVGLSGSGAACSDEAIDQIARRRPPRSTEGGGGAQGGSGSSTGGYRGGATSLGAGGAVAAAGSEGLAAPPPGVDPATGEPAEPGAAAGPSVSVEEASWRLASYQSEISDLNVNQSSWNPSTGDLQIEIQPPAIDAALGEFFQGEEITIAGRVDGLGEFEAPMTFTVYDSFGNPTEMTFTMTTGSLERITADGQMIVREGKPFGPDGKGTIIGMEIQDPSSPLGGTPAWIEIPITLNNGE